MLRNWLIATVLEELLLRAGFLHRSFWPLWHLSKWGEVFTGKNFAFLLQNPNPIHFIRYSHVVVETCPFKTKEEFPFKPFGQRMGSSCRFLLIQFPVFVKIEMLSYEIVFLTDMAITIDVIGRIGTEWNFSGFHHLGFTVEIRLLGPVRRLTAWIS